MKYSGSLVKSEREQIFSLFLTKERLRFAEIEKLLKLRSNMVSYHLTEMIKEKIIQKNNQYYQLTEEGEKYLPIFSHVTGKEIGPVPVILVAVISKQKVLLLRRKSRPYKNYWSLVGGKMKLQESFDDASVRLVREKTGLESRFVSLNAILHEKVHGEGVKHSFILFFTIVEAKDKRLKVTSLKNLSSSNSEELKWFDKKGLDEEGTIPSDYWLINSKLSKKIAVFTADMKDDEGQLKDFRVKNINRKRDKDKR